MVSFWGLSKIFADALLHCISKIIRGLSFHGCWHTRSVAMVIISWTKFLRYQSNHEYRENFMSAKFLIIIYSQRWWCHIEKLYTVTVYCSEVSIMPNYCWMPSVATGCWNFWELFCRKCYTSNFVLYSWTCACNRNSTVDCCPKG